MGTAFLRGPSIFLAGARTHGRTDARGATTHAGLPPSEPGRYYSEEQMETRIYALRHAYKAARAFARESVASK